MCTVVLLRQPNDKWPLLIAANRDEMMGRPWAPPGRHWLDRKNVVAGIDHLAGGSWMGINDEGVVACVLNRPDSLGPDPSLRSRGEIVLEALDHADAVDAANALIELDGRSYRSFNLMIADNREAFWLKSLGPAGDGNILSAPIPAGISMITALDLNDPSSPRIQFYKPKFEAAKPPNVDAGNWKDWENLLSCTDYGEKGDVRDGMRIITDIGFGTLSSALLALPSDDRVGVKPLWLFSNGPPGEASFEAVDLL